MIEYVGKERDYQSRMLTKLIVVGVLILAMIAIGQSSRHRQAQMVNRPANDRPNREQLIVLWVGIALLSLIGLYPPWMYTLHMKSEGSTLQMQRAAGYHPLFEPPEPASPDSSNLYIDGVRLDFPRIGVQIIIVALVTGGLFWTLRDRPSRQR